MSVDNSPRESFFAGASLYAWREPFSSAGEILNGVLPAPQQALMRLAQRGYRAGRRNEQLSSHGATLRRRLLLGLFAVFALLLCAVEAHAIYPQTPRYVELNKLGR